MFKHNSSKSDDSEQTGSFSSQWKGILVGLLSGFTKNITDSVTEKVRYEVDQKVWTMKRNAAGILLLGVGLIFLLVAGATLIEQYTKTSGSGYLVVGVVSLFVGLIIIKK